MTATTAQGLKRTEAVLRSEKLLTFQEGVSPRMEEEGGSLLWGTVQAQLTEECEAIHCLHLQTRTADHGVPQSSSCAKGTG